MRALSLVYSELGSAGNDKVMTLTSCCTWIRVNVTGVRKEAVQQCIDSKVRAIRCDTLTVAQLFFCVLLTLHLSITLDNDQLDTHLLYFTIRLL